MMTAPIVTDSPFALSAGRHDPRLKVQSLGALGFRAFSATFFDDASWAELPVLLGELDKSGLLLATARIKADVSTGLIDPRINDLLPELARRGARLELFIEGTGQYDIPSAPRADTRAIELVRRIADLAGEKSVGISLAHRAGFWLERLEDSVRLLMRMNRDEIGVTFSLFDWLCVDGENLEPRLHLAIPRLTNLILSGATRHGPDQCTPEPLDASGYDWFHFLGTAKRLGYAGPVSIDLHPHGHPVEILKRSLETYRKR